MLKELSEKGSIMSLSTVTNSFELSDFQTYSLAASFILEKCVISLDTGLGKTIVAGALINLDMSDGRWLFVSKNNNLIQTAKKLNSIVVDRVVQYSSGTIDNVKALISNCQPNAVIVITYDTLNNLGFLDFLFGIRKSFSGIIIDESHNIGNKGSNRSEILKHMMLNSFKYQYMLTATPLSTNPFQIINQVSMIDPELVPDPEELAMKHTCYTNGKATGYHDLDELADFISIRYISFTREELGLKGNYSLRLHLCESILDKPPADVESLKAEKSLQANNSIQIIVNLVSEYVKRGKHGLIYANMTVYKDMLLEKLSDITSCCILDGRVSSTDKNLIQGMYNRGEYSVLISNLEEGADLPSDFIIFYELSVKYKQFIGRGERGLSGKNMDIHFVLIDKSYEVEFFYRNIFKRSLLLEAVCLKDISEIKEIERQLSCSLSDDSRYDLEELSMFFEDEE